MSRGAESPSHALLGWSLHQTNLVDAWEGKLEVIRLWYSNQDLDTFDSSLSQWSIS